VVNNAKEQAIRVLHVLPNFGAGGAERMVGDLVRGLDKSRFAAMVVSLFGPAQTDVERELNSAAIPVRYLEKHKGFDIRMYCRLRSVIREFGPHIIHTHRYVLRYLIPIREYRDVAVKVHTVHNLAQYEVDTLGKWVHRLAFRLGVVPVAIAESVSDSIEAVYGIKAPRLISNGIRVERYALARLPRRDWRKKEGFGPDDILVVSVGRLAPQKNHILLIRAFRRCCSAALGLHLIVVGDGPLRGDLLEEVQRLGLADRVHFLGVREDIPDILSAADLFVLPSNWEGNPLSVMEAMAAGRAVIATNVGGVPELVENGETGIIVPPGDIEALSAAIIELATDPNRRGVMGLRAAAKAQTDFDVSTMVKRYEELYEELFEAARATQARVC